MSKNKDVFVWVARHKKSGWKDYDTHIYEVCPARHKTSYEDVYYKYHPEYSKQVKFSLDKLELKRGQCKKYKLVEAKGGL